MTERYAHQAEWALASAIQALPDPPVNFEDGEAENQEVSPPTKTVDHAQWIDTKMDTKGG